jgi:DNA repair exonuclease SbcCD nuclease subunit
MIEFIIHLADIHIRTGNLQASRYEEYINVFNNLKESIINQIEDKQMENKVIIYIAGDIFHNKNKIENYGLFLFKSLITILLNISPLIIIPGNHDFQQSNIDEPSLISSLLYPDSKNQLYLLDKTQYIEIDNILFSTVAIQNSLEEGNTSGISSTLIPFPNDYSKTYRFKIALFHGSFGKTKMNNIMDTPENNSYPLEWIEDFDYSLLGDIHLRQTGTFGNMKYAYSGSLIQQNFGEDPILHGYYIWNLEDNKIIPINVYNDIGFLNLFYINNTWKIKYKKNYENVITLIQNKYFPKKPKIKIHGKYTNLDELINLLISYDITYEIQTTTYNQNEEILVAMNNIDSIKIIDYKENLLLYLKDNIKENNIEIIQKWIKHLDTLLISDCIHIPKISDRNKLIQKKIDLYIQSTDKDIETKKLFIIKYISWNYLSCYGPNCWFNFETSHNNVVLVNGKNASGKSSFYEIICYALFGEPIPSRYNKNSQTAIVNSRASGFQRNPSLSNKLKPLGGCEENSSGPTASKKNNTILPSSTIHIILNNIEYIITRQYHKTSKNTIEFKNTTLSYKNNKKPIKIGNPAIKDWLKENIGSIEDFLSNYMITQDLDSDIFSLTSSKQLDILDKQFRLNSIQTLKLLIDETKKAYKYVKDNIETLILSNTLKNPSFDQDIYDTTLLQFTKIKDTLISYQNNFDTIYIDYNKFPLSIFDLNISQEIEKLPIIDYTLEELNKEKNLLLYKLEAAGPESENINYNLLSQKYNSNIQSEFNKLIKPLRISTTLEFLNKEKNILEKWFDYIIIPLKNITSYYSLKITEFKLYIKQLSHNKPNKPDKNIIITQDLDFLIEFCKNNKYISKPTITIPKTKPKELYDDLIHLRDEILQKNIKINNSIDNSQIELISLQNKFNIQKPLDNLIKPALSTIIISKWLFEYNTLHDLSLHKYKILENLNIIQDLILQKNSILISISDISTKINYYNSSSYEFNPDCLICSKQPWLIHKKSLELDLNTYKNKLIDIDNLLLNKDISNIDIELKNITKWILIYENLSLSYEYYSQLHIEWNLYLPLEEKYLKSKSIIDLINLNISDITTKLLNFTSYIKDNNTKLKIINKNIYIYDLISSWTIYNSHQMLLQYYYTEWLNKFQDYEKKLILYENKYNISINNDKYTLDFLPRIQQYYLLFEEFHIYKKYTELENIILSYNFIQTLLNIQIITRKNYLFEALELLPLHLNKISIKDSILHLQIEYDSINKLIIEFESIKILILTNNKNNQEITLFLDYILLSYNALDEFHNCIDSFKEWLYNTTILPTLLDKVNFNTQISSSKSSLPTILKAYILEKDKSISWFIIKNINGQSFDIPILKASGFQKFILSLSLRLALINSNISSNKQLFIDEGFVSCDYSNLEIIPEFLYNLTQSQSYSIILVSHLITIKDNIDKNVNIEIIDGFSLLQFGSQL